MSGEERARLTGRLLMAGAALQLALFLAAVLFARFAPETHRRG